MTLEEILINNGPLMSSQLAKELEKAKNTLYNTTSQ